MSTAFKLECKARNDEGGLVVFTMTGAHLATYTSAKEKGDFSISNESWSRVRVKPPDGDEFTAYFKDITDLENNSVNDKVEQYVNARRKSNAERYADVGKATCSWTMITNWHLFLRSKNRHPVNSPKANVKMFLKWSTLSSDTSKTNGTTEIDVENFETQLTKLFTNGSVIITAIQEFSS